MYDMTATALSTLMVEPSPTQQRILTRQLNRSGLASIRYVRTGTEALAQLRDNPPDLVLSALYLPDMTGTDIVVEMRGDRRFDDVAFVLVSSETRFDHLDDLKQAGSMAILPKPFRPDQLETTLQAVLAYLNADADAADEDEIGDHRVLVVDDSDLSRKHVCRVLQRVGLRNLEQATDGQQAAEIIEATPFDLIVTDYNMPRMDGQQLATFIRNHSPQQEVPILMITSEQDADRLAAVRQAGVSAICPKPFDFIEIGDLIRSLLA